MKQWVVSRVTSNQGKTHPFQFGCISPHLSQRERTKVIPTCRKALCWQKQRPSIPSTATVGQTFMCIFAFQDIYWAHQTATAHSNPKKKSGNNLHSQSLQAPHTHSQRRGFPHPQPGGHIALWKTFQGPHANDGQSNACKCSLCAIGCFPHTLYFPPLRQTRGMIRVLGCNPVR